MEKSVEEDVESDAGRAYGAEEGVEEGNEELRSIFLYLFVRSSLLRLSLLFLSLPLSSATQHWLVHLYVHGL